jgi:hypothetical protein
VDAGVAVRSRWSVIVVPTNAQVRAEEYEAERGRPMPGVTLAMLGYAWHLHDVVRMRVAASGRELTADQAARSAARAVEALLDADTARVWMEESRHERAGRVDMAELAGGDC